MKNKNLFEIAEEIATLERLLNSNASLLEKEKAEYELMGIVQKYELSLIDMMELDEILQTIL